MAKATQTTTESNKPVQVFRLKGVKVAVFENHSADGVPWFKTSLQRIYRVGEEWKTAQSLSREDIPVARLLLQRAWEWILQREANAVKEESKD